MSLHLRKRLLRRLRQALTWLLWSLTILVLLAVAIDVYCETAGLPRFVVRRYIVDRLADDGIYSEVGGVKAGLLNGIVIDQLTVRDRELGAYKLAQFNEVRLSIAPSQIFNETKKIRQIVARDGRIWMPLEHPGPDGSGDYVPVKVKHLNITLVRDYSSAAPDELRFAEIDADAVVYEGVNVRVRRTILRWTHDPTAPKQPLTVKPLLDKIPPVVHRVLDEVREVGLQTAPGRPVELTVAVNSDLDQPEQTQLELALAARNLLYNGLYLTRAELDAGLRPDAIQIDKLRLDIEDDEYVQATGRLDRGSGRFTGAVAVRTYPGKVLRAVAPEMLKHIRDFRFDGPPPRLDLTIHRADRHDLKAGDYTLDATVRDVVYVEAPVRNAKATVNYRAGEIEIPSVVAVLGPDYDLRGRVHYSTRHKDLFVRAAFAGDPRVFRLFSRDQKFRRDLTDAWQMFEFSPLARPRLNMDLYRWHNDDGPQAVLEGDMAATSFRFNGVFVSAMQGTTVIDFNQRLLLVDRLEIYRNGAPAIGQIAYSFPRENPSVRFDLESNFDTNAVMTLIMKQWKGMLARQGWSFKQTPYVHASGHAALKRAADYKVGVRVEAPFASWQDFKGQGARAHLLFTPDLVSIQANAERIDHLGWIYRDVKATDFKVTPESLQAHFSGTSAAIGNVTFAQPDLRLESDMKDVVLKQLKCKSVVVGMGDNERLRLGATALPRLEIKDGQVETMGVARGVSHVYGRTGNEKEITRAKALTAAVNWRDDALTIKGDLDGVEWLPQNVSAAKTSFTTVLKDDAVHTRLGAPKAVFASGLELRQCIFRTSTKDRETKASFEIKEARYNETTAADVSGDFTYEGSSWQAKNIRCKQLKSGPFQLVNAGGDAVYAYDTFSMKAKAEKMLVGSIAKDGDKKKSDSKTASPKWEIPNVSAKIFFQDGVWGVRDLQGRLYDGKLFGQLQYDTKKRTSKVVLNLLHAELAQFRRTPDSKSMRGRLTGRFLLDLVHRKDGELFIHGGGRIGIAEATIYKIPLINDFFRIVRAVPVLGRVISPDDAAKITKLEADVSFEGKRIDITRAQTDGKVIALDANGYYWWETGGVDIRVRAEIIKIGFFRRLFVRRMIGTLDDYEWEKWAFFKDLIRDTKKPVDPASIGKEERRKLEKTEDGDTSGDVLEIVPVPEVEPDKSDAGDSALDNTEKKETQ